MFLAASAFFVAALFLVGFLDVRRSLFNEVEREIVAILLVISPVYQAVLAEHHALGPRVLGGDLLQGEAELEAWRSHGVQTMSSPYTSLVIFLELAAQIAMGAFGCVIHVFAGHKGVQRGVDGGRARIEVKRAVRVHAYHLIFGG